MNARARRRKTLKMRVSDSEIEKILARLPAGMELSVWLRSLALGEPRGKTSALALAEYSTGKELAYLAASVDAVAREVAAGKPDSLPEWLVVLRRIREAGVELAYRDPRPQAERDEQIDGAIGENPQ